MSGLADFTALMADVKQYQQGLSAFYEKMAHPEEKAMMEKLMQQLESAREEAEQIVPQTIQQIQDSARRSSAEAKKQLAQIEQRQKKFQAESEALKAAAPAVAAAKPKSEVRVDPKLGPTLRLELLQRFGQTQPDAANSGSIKEAWEDWQ